MRTGEHDQASIRKQDGYQGQTRWGLKGAYDNIGIRVAFVRAPCARSLLRVERDGYNQTDLLFVAMLGYR